MGSDGALRVFSVAGKREVRRYERLGNGMGAVAWSPDGSLLAGRHIRLSRRGKA